jgi:hypothetical protein
VLSGCRLEATAVRGALASAAVVGMLVAAWAASVMGTSMVPTARVGMLLVVGALGVAAVVHGCLLMLWILLPRLLWLLLIVHLSDSSLSNEFIIQDTRFEYPIIFITFKLQTTFNPSLPIKYSQYFFT